MPWLNVASLFLCDCLLRSAQPQRVTMVLHPDYDLDKTIFKSLDSKLNRIIMKAKLGNQVCLLAGLLPTKEAALLL